MSEQNPGNNGQYYQHHVFFCLNDRANGEDSCAHHGAQAMFDHCKARVKAEGLNGPGKVRVNKAGCMDRCAGGPIMAVYPEVQYQQQPVFGRLMGRLQLWRKPQRAGCAQARYRAGVPLVLIPASSALVRVACLDRGVL